MVAQPISSNQGANLTEPNIQMVMALISSNGRNLISEFNSNLRDQVLAGTPEIQQQANLTPGQQAQGGNNKP